MVEIQSRGPERWVKAMMVDELSMLEDERNPLANGQATFIAFAIAGSVPLLVYLIGLIVPIQPSSVTGHTRPVFFGEGHRQTGVFWQLYLAVSGRL